MGKDSFQFKQFTIRHDRCSMRVGTDGVLIGAWAGQALRPKTCLDIGTGSGLIALMLAQRFPQSMVRGIDIDGPSVEQARENAAASPFAERISMEQTDFSRLCMAAGRQSIAAEKIDLVVSNPPFFEEDTPSASVQMNRAKHTTDLTFGQLTAGAAAVMTDGGAFAVILPYSAAHKFIGIAAECGLYLNRRCDVRGSARREWRRVMMEFSTDKTAQARHAELTLCMPDGSRSAEYAELTKDFYL